MADREELLSELGRRLAAFAHLGDQAAVLDPEALALAAVLLQAAMPVVPRHDGTGQLDVEAAQLVADLHAARNSLLGYPPEERLAGLLDLAIYQFRSIAAGEPQLTGTALYFSPGTPSAAEAWHGEAAVLFAAFQQEGQIQLLQLALTMWQQVVAATPAGHSDRPEYLSALATALLVRFEHGRELADLDQAIQAERAAAAAASADDPARALYLSWLCLLLGTRFDDTGRPADLDEAVLAGRGAFAAGLADDMAAFDCLGNLANALLSRFELSGSRADLDEAIDLSRAALAATPADEPDRQGFGANLCGALLARFEYSGAPGELDEAIAVGRDAVGATAPDDPGRAVGLANLGSALRVRGELVGALPDLADAITAGRAAVDAVSAGDPARPGHLSSLGLSLLTWFERTGSAADLDDAIAAAGAAAGAAGDSNPARAGYLSNLGVALRARFDLAGQPADLDDCIEASQAALAATPAGHPGRGGYLSNLGLVLRARFGRTGDPADLAGSIEASQAALAAAPADHPVQAMVLRNLGLALLAESRRSGDQQLAERARQAFRQAAQSEVATPSVRMKAAQAWGQSAGELGDWPDAARGYQAAAQLLAVSAWHGLDRADRIHALAQSWGLGADAAAAALRAGQPELAVELLEQARGILLTHAIDARAHRGMLSERAPELARRLDDIRAELDRPEPDPAVIARAGIGGTADGRTAPVSEQRIRQAASVRAARRRELGREWDDLVARARRIPGLADFLWPMPFADLRRCADGGPVVIVNISRHGCHALVVTREDLSVLPLDRVSAGDAARRIEELRDALAAVDGADRRWQHAQRRLDDTLGWLWDSIANPVLSAVTSAAGVPGPGVPGMATPAEGHPAAPAARLWWCPAGLASFLPLHAAGRHSEPGHAVMDHVVSSYTPTLRALIDARAAARAAAPPGRMLAVALPATPGLPSLPAAEREARAVASRVPGTTTLAGLQATRATLLAELSRHAFLHFAGHGRQDPDDVTSGALYTYDQRAHGPVTISDLAALRLTDARLAFLSACQTAVGATDVPDEAVHLAGALLLAGFTHVVATLWAISDTLAPRVAGEFYPRLIIDDQGGSGRLDPAGAARALHDVVRPLPDQLSSLLWAPYVHIGP